MSVKCPKCHSQNPDTKSFCADCGTALASSPLHPVEFTETLEAPLDELATGFTFAGRYQIIESVEI